MKTQTKQHKFWLGSFGAEYLKRNPMSPKELNDDYKKNKYGVTRTAMNREFLRGLDKNARILEVGASFGNQLILLQEMGFKHLYGVELSPGAVEFAKGKTRNINIIQGDALDLPFKDNYFDLVFTSGVLIHIAPERVMKAMAEICRCTKRYVWGFEYFAPEHTNIVYRGNKNVLWKGNFSQLYCDTCPQLALVKRKTYDYNNEPGNTDEMFLLEKKS